MKQNEFYDHIRSGGKIRRRSRPDEILTVILHDSGSVVAVVGDRALGATRLINPSNWGFADLPGGHMTDTEFDGLKIGDRVRYPYGENTETFTVVLNDGDWVVAVKGTETVEVVRLRNPGNLVRC